MDINKMTIGELKEITGLLNTKKSETTPSEIDHGTRIVILQRGWVFVGRYIQCGEYVTLKNAACIRRWGTTKGLPELAQRGPLGDTVLEKGAETRFHILTEIGSIRCREDAWLGKLEA
jgi:hypothetical protein